MKKFLSVVLSLLMLLSVLSVSTFAVSETAKAQAETQKAVESIAGAFVGAKEDAVITVEKDLAEKAVAENGKDITVGELSEMLASYVAVPLNDETKSVADRIADESTYRVTVLDSGKKTVFILVNLEENPELFGIEVFHDAVMKMAENQKAVLPEGEDVTLLDYQKIAGELALHMIVFKTTKPLVDGNAASKEIKELYEKSRIAELNINEDRVPASLIDFVGMFFMKIVYALRTIFA